MHVSSTIKVVDVRNNIFKTDHESNILWFPSKRAVRGNFSVTLGKHIHTTHIHIHFKSQINLVFYSKLPKDLLLIKLVNFMILYEVSRFRGSKLLMEALAHNLVLAFSEKSWERLEPCRDGQMGAHPRPHSNRWRLP